MKQSSSCFHPSRVNVTVTPGRTDELRSHAFKLVLNFVVYHLLSTHILSSLTSTGTFSTHPSRRIPCYWTLQPPTLAASSHQSCHIRVPAYTWEKPLLREWGSLICSNTSANVQEALYFGRYTFPWTCIINETLVERIYLISTNIRESDQRVTAQCWCVCRTFFIYTVSIM
jgi:hypothetical protein